VLQARGDPIRLQIVRILDQADGAIACNEMGLPVAKSTGSHHLRLLREAGGRARSGRRNSAVLHAAAGRPGVAVSGLLDKRARDTSHVM